MKRFMSFLLIASLMLVGLCGHTPAEAAGVGTAVEVGGVRVSRILPDITPTYWVSDGSGGITDSGATEDNYIAKYETEFGKLTLRNADITAVCSPSGGLRFSGGNLIIELVGDNTVVPAASGHDGVFDATADPSTHTLTIQGSGSLTATANGNGRNGLRVRNLIISQATVMAQGSSTGAENRGIKARSVTINSGSVTAVSADAVSGNTGPSAGIEAAEFVTVNGGTLIATGGGNAMTRQSYGILSPTVTIAGGTVTATGGQVQSNVDPRYSYGISASTGITLNGGTVIAKTNATANIRGAMSQAPALTGMGISVASPNNDGSDPVAYVAGDIATYMYLKAEPTTKEATPSATVDYSAEKLSGLVSGAVYLVGETEYTADGEGKLAIDDAWFGTIIELRKKGNGTTTSNSEPQSIALAARPAVPACVATQPTASVATGSISGITTEMEYSTDGGASWTSGDGNELSGLTAGTTVTIRFKATGTAPKGVIRSIVIVAYSSQEDTPSALVDYPNEKLNGLVNSAVYFVGMTEYTADGEGKLAIDDAWFGTIIELRKKGNGTTTVNSNPQNITLAARPAAPVCVVTQPTASVATGSISGITTEMKYSTDGGASWTPGDGNELSGLTAGTTVTIRFKATGTAPKGAIQSIAIVAYTPPAPPTGNTGGGDSPVISAPTEIGQGASLGSSQISQLINRGENLTVNGSEGAKLVFDLEALKGISNQMQGSIQADIQDVSRQHQDTHPGRTVYSLSVRSGGTNISNFGGEVTVTLPYELPAGQDPENVTIWHQSADGTLTEIPGVYDSLSGKVTFKVNHFSIFAIGIKEKIEEPSTFADVKTSDWYSEAVTYVTTKGLMSGTAANIFSPGVQTTRGMIVSILWRMEGEEKPVNRASFADVGAGKYYAQAVAWAAEKGIVSGYSAESFAPEEGITREQLAGILSRYSAYKGEKAETTTELNRFSDGTEVSLWAADAVRWAVEKGLLGSTGNNRLEPQGGASRAQLAAILQRFFED